MGAGVNGDQLSQTLERGWQVFHAGDEGELALQHACLRLSARSSGIGSLPAVKTKPSSVTDKSVPTSRVWQKASGPRSSTARRKQFTALRLSAPVYTAESSA